EFALVAQKGDASPTARNQVLGGFQLEDHAFFVSSERLSGSGENENLSTRETTISLGFSDSEHAAVAANARRIIAKFGGQTSLARLLGRSQSTVQHWAKTGSIPAK